MKILIIDDDLTIRTLYGAVFTRQGHSVETHESAMGALGAVMTFGPDVVLLDVHMPGIRGDRMVQLLGEQDAFEKVPFVLHSGGSDGDLQRLARECGAAGAIPKDRTPLEVLKALERFAGSAT